MVAFSPRRVSLDFNHGVDRLSRINQNLFCTRSYLHRALIKKEDAGGSDNQKKQQDNIVLPDIPQSEGESEIGEDAVGKGPEFACRIFRSFGMILIFQMCLFVLFKMM